MYLKISTAEPIEFYNIGRLDISPRMVLGYLIENLNHGVSYNKLNFKNHFYFASQLMLIMSLEEELLNYI